MKGATQAYKSPARPASHSTSPATAASTSPASARSPHAAVLHTLSQGLQCPEDAADDHRRAQPRVPPAQSARAAAKSTPRARQQSQETNITTPSVPSQLLALPQPRPLTHPRPPPYRKLPRGSPHTPTTVLLQPPPPPLLQPLPAHDAAAAVPPTHHHHHALPQPVPRRTKYPHDQQRWSGWRRRSDGCPCAPSVPAR